MNGTDTHEQSEREVLIELNDHENRILELGRRMCVQEQQTKAISELSLNVRELAVTMKSMVREQISQGERITRLERAPLARYETIICAIISAICGAISGAFFV